MNYHDYFTYDAVTGNLIHKDRPASMFKREQDQLTFNSKYAGTVAGYVHENTGHVYVNVGKMRKAHRVIWEMHNGPIPEGMLIDHINMIGSDNRLENLRLATKSTNGMNRPANRGKFGRLKGITVDKRDGVYSAEITANGNKLSLGRFKTKGMAALAYAKASLRYHGEFSPFYRKKT